MKKQNLQLRILQEVVDFFNPSWYTIFLYLPSLAIWFLLYLRGLLSFLWLLMGIPLLYVCVCVIVYVKYKLVWSSTPAGRESMKREKKI